MSFQWWFNSESIMGRWWRFVFLGGLTFLWLFDCLVVGNFRLERQPKEQKLKTFNFWGVLRREVAIKDFRNFMGTKEHWFIFCDRVCEDFRKVWTTLLVYVGFVSNGIFKNFVLFVFDTMDVESPRSTLQKYWAIGEKLDSQKMSYWTGTHVSLLEGRAMFFSTKIGTHFCECLQETNKVVPCAMKEKRNMEWKQLLCIFVSVITVKNASSGKLTQMISSLGKKNIFRGFCFQLVIFCIF